MNLNITSLRINKQQLIDNKFLIINSFLIFLILFEGFLYFQLQLRKKSLNQKTYKNPIGTLKPKEKTEEKQATPSTTLPPSEIGANSPFHILLLGMDRRYAEQTNYRTDVNMVLSLSSDRKTLLMTSIPRDLWLDTAKINAFYNIGGMDLLKEKIKEITGFTINKYIMVDFDAAVWFTDTLGGVEVPVERAFTDNNYPNDREGQANTITVTFPQGLQRMDGEKALIYARSRYGNNGEGSDFMRMRRQQNFLKAIPEAFFSPKSLFSPFVLEEFYRLVTQHIKTDLTVGDTSILYNLLKDYKQGRVEQVVLDHEYLYTPSAADYGGAYVLRPKNEDFTPIHTLLKSKII